MSRITRPTRMIAAIALFLSTAVLFAASPASAAASGDMVNNNDGSMTVTWSVADQSESISINFYASGTTCPALNNSFGILFGINGGIGMIAPSLSPSPSLLSAGSTVKSGSLPPASMQISAGSYLACLYLNAGQGQGVLDQSLEITFSVVVPTTTTTTTTTTAPAADPVAPAFTG
jgi:hypothetical protein